MTHREKRQFRKLATKVDRLADEIDWLGTDASDNVDQDEHNSDLLALETRIDELEAQLSDLQDQVEPPT